MVALSPPISFPPWIITSDPTYAVTTLDDTGEYSAGIFFAPVTDTITKVSFRTGTVTTGGDVDVRIETLGTDGLPSGTLWGTNTNVIQTIAATDDNVWFEVTLTSPASVVMGDLFCIVVRHVSGASSVVRDNNSTYIQWPQSAVNTGTPTTAASIPVMSIYFNTNGYFPIGIISPYSAITGRTFNNTSTPDVRGNKFVAPFDCKCSGFIIRADFDASATIKLYDSDGVSVLASFSNGVDYPAITASSSNRVIFNTEADLIAGQTYYIGLEPDTGTNITIQELISPSSAVRAQGPYGANAVAVTAKDPSGTGSWTEIPEAVYPISILISEITTGGSASEHSYTFVG